MFFSNLTVITRNSGGWSSPSTSEFFDPAVGHWKPGPTLRHRRKRHCMVSYSDCLVLMGGTKTGNLVELYNITSGVWREMPTLLAYRTK